MALGWTWRGSYGRGVNYDTDMGRKGIEYLNENWRGRLCQSCYLENE